MKSIRYIEDKFKLYILTDKIFYFIVLIIISITSFGLGRMYMQPYMFSLQNQTAGITLQSDNSLEDDRLTIPKHLKDDNTVIGSKNGTRYYKESCSGVNRIHEENRLYFLSQKHAEAAGYTQAANCF